MTKIKEKEKRTIKCTDKQTNALKKIYKQANNYWRKKIYLKFQMNKEKEEEGQTNEQTYLL